MPYSFQVGGGVTCFFKGNIFKSDALPKRKKGTKSLVRFYFTLRSRTGRLMRNFRHSLKPNSDPTLGLKPAS